MAIVTLSPSGLLAAFWTRLLVAAGTGGDFRSPVEDLMKIAKCVACSICFSMFLTLSFGQTVRVKQQDLPAKLEALLSGRGSQNRVEVTVQKVDGGTATGDLSSIQEDSVILIDRKSARGGGTGQASITFESVSSLKLSVHRSSGTRTVAGIFGGALGLLTGTLIAQGAKNNAQVYGFMAVGTAGGVLLARSIAAPRREVWIIETRSPSGTPSDRSSIPDRDSAGPAFCWARSLPGYLAVGSLKELELTPRKNASPSMAMRDGYE